MNQNTENSSIRSKLASLIGADRWIDETTPMVAPLTTVEICSLMKGYSSGVITVIGQGTDFPDDYHSVANEIMISTRNLKGQFELSSPNHTLTLDAGWSIIDTKAKLKENDSFISSLCQLNSGTIGGRLASISSRPRINNDQGWIQTLLGLNVVLPSGELLRLGGKNIKDVAGYDLKHIFTGSKGSVGVIVSATFRLYHISQFKQMSNVSIDKTEELFSKKWKKILDPHNQMRAGA